MYIGRNELSSSLECAGETIGGLSMVRDPDFLLLGLWLLGYLVVWIWGLRGFSELGWGKRWRTRVAAGWCWDRKVEGEVNISCLLQVEKQRGKRDEQMELLGSFTLGGVMYALLHCSSKTLKITSFISVWGVGVFFQYDDGYWELSKCGCSEEQVWSKSCMIQL